MRWSGSSSPFLFGEAGGLPRMPGSEVRCYDSIEVLPWKPFLELPGFGVWLVFFGLAADIKLDLVRSSSSPFSNSNLWVVVAFAAAAATLASGPSVARNGVVRANSYTTAALSASCISILSYRMNVLATIVILLTFLLYNLIYFYF